MEDVLRLMSEYLGPKELLRLANTCRLAQTWITHELAIRSILCHGSKNGMKSLDTVIRLARNGKIWFPSPLRLLRVSLGKRCERGTTLLHDMLGRTTRGQTCGMELNFARPDYGVFFCWGCTQEMTTQVKRTRKADLRKFPMEVLTHERMAAWGLDGHQADRSSIYLWSLTMQSTARSRVPGGGEFIGPILTVSLMERLRSRVKDEKRKKAKTKEEEKKVKQKKKKKEGVVVARVEAEKEEEVEFESLLEALEHYLASDEAVERGAAAVKEAGVVRLLEWYDQFNPAAEEFRKKEKGKQEAAKAVRLAAKKEKVEAMEAKLIRMMVEGVGLPFAGDASLNGPNIAEVHVPILQGTVIYTKLMRPMYLAPSLYRGTHLTFIARLLRRTFAHALPDLMKMGFLARPTTLLESIVTFYYSRQVIHSFSEEHGAELQGYVPSIESPTQPASPFHLCQSSSKPHSMEDEALFATCIYSISVPFALLVMARESAFSSPIDMLLKIVAEKVSMFRWGPRTLLFGGTSSAVSMFAHFVDVKEESALLHLLYSTSQQIRAETIRKAEGGGRKRKRETDDSFDRVDEMMRLVPILETTLSKHRDALLRMPEVLNTKLLAFEATCEELADRLDAWILESSLEAQRIIRALEKGRMRVRAVAAMRCWATTRWDEVLTQDHLLELVREFEADDQ
ncbi:hypothetical protein HDU67_005229 [Dinochytrium kinnereticum]|nr:hypothetical protein HDU67_005229 [Dinochytrium kinnereticum]